MKRIGKTGLHSLTSVTFTPHDTSYDEKPLFKCQERSEGYCESDRLGNCNECPSKPESAWPYMSSLARKYLKEEYGFKYKESLFSMKPILKTTEVDDSRPFVFVSDDYVYMLQNIKPRMKTAFDETGAIRSTLQIWKYDTEMNLIDFYRIRNDASIQYFSIVDSKGRIYICFTEDKQHLNFALKGDIAVMPIDLQSLEKHGW